MGSSEIAIFLIKLFRRQSQIWAFEDNNMSWTHLPKLGLSFILSMEIDTFYSNDTHACGKYIICTGYSFHPSTQLNSSYHYDVLQTLAVSLHTSQLNVIVLHQDGFCRCFWSLNNTTETYKMSKLYVASILRQIDVGISCCPDTEQPKLN